MGYKHDFDLRSKYHCNIMAKHKAYNTNESIVWCHQVTSDSHPAQLTPCCGIK